jgi:hypothetical protein
VTQPQGGRICCTEEKQGGQGCLLAVGYSTVLFPPPRDKTFLVLARNGEGVINYEGEEGKKETNKEQREIKIASNYFLVSFLF